MSPTSYLDSLQSAKNLYSIDVGSILTCLELGHAAEFQSVGRRSDYIVCGRVGEIIDESNQTSTGGRAC